MLTTLCDYIRLCNLSHLTYEYHAISMVFLHCYKKVGVIMITYPALRIKWKQMQDRNLKPSYSQHTNRCNLESIRKVAPLGINNLCSMHQMYTLPALYTRCTPYLLYAPDVHPTCSMHQMYSSSVSPFQAYTATPRLAIAAAAWSWVEKMLQLDHCTCKQTNSHCMTYSFALLSLVQLAWDLHILVNLMSVTWIQCIMAI